MKEHTVYIEKIDFHDDDKQTVAWHTVSEDIVYKRLQVTEKGLNPEHVEERQREFGRNVLPAKEPPTLLQVFLHQFASPLIYILLVAGVIAILIQDYKDAAFIIAVVLLNAIIGTFQEYRAEKSAHALQSLIKSKARVRRRGVQREISAEDLVPGDIVLLESGDKVPADIRLVKAKNLAIDESLLTGESIASEKDGGQISAETAVSDRKNMAYAGSSVAAGRGTGIVVATGVYTEVGKIAKSISESVGAKPPLVIRMERFAQQISFIVLGFAAILGVFAFAQGMPFADVFILVVAMTVSAIPEGLPVALTVALSLATNRMAKRNVIVRKLPAVESLGSCTCIASDKTGTLTVNQQTVKTIELADGQVIQVTGEGYNDKGEVQTAEGETPAENTLAILKEIARAGVLSNEASLVSENGKWEHNGDAVDVAMLAFGFKMGLIPEEIHAEHATLGDIPFESEKRYAAKIYENNGNAEIAIKGAAEAILPLCKNMRRPEGDVDLDSAAIGTRALEMAREGFRVLAVAIGDVPRETDFEDFKDEDIPSLTLLGLVGFIDPLRPEVVDAVHTARQAGIRVVMITGDHPATAFAIARDLDIAEFKEDVITGMALAEIGSYEVPEFYEMVKNARVFARVTPMQKLHIVDALIKIGHFVAVTGDGVNDAPALRKANIGVAMGSGTDVAKDTAQMIAIDDNFASIVGGVEEGRFAYANVRKVTLFLISTGAAELVLISLAILFGMPIPLLAVQILWLNLVTNGIQDVALAFEGGEKGVMSLPPRDPKEGIFNKLMIQQVVLSGMTMAALCFAAWIYLINYTTLSLDSARNLLLLLLVMLQFYHVFNSRSEYKSVFRVPLSRNPVLMVGVLVAFSLHILATQLPFLQTLLRTEPVAWYWWLIMGAIGWVLILVMDVFKMINNRRNANGMED